MLGLDGRVASNQLSDNIRIYTFVCCDSVHASMVHISF